MLIPIIACQVLLSWYVSRSIHFIRLAPQNLFIADLVGRAFVLPVWFFYICGALSTVFIWLIAKHFLDKNWEFLPPFIFATSLWPAYLVASQANSILTLTILLATILIFLKWKSGQISIWNLAPVLGLLYCTSLLMAPAILLIYLILIAIGWINKRNRVTLLSIILIMYTPVILGSLYNPPGIKNLIKQQTQFITNPGLVNDINGFRGEDLQTGFGRLSKFTDNKYLYLSEYLLLKTLKHATPSSYFTPQEKLLNYSFSSPIYLGFIFPFLFGLYLMAVEKSGAKKMLLLSLPLILPSLLSQPLVDLQKLIFILPTMIFVISYGVASLYKNRGSTGSRLVLWTSCGLVVIQMVVSIFDISFREYPRFVRYFGPNQTLVGKQ